MVENEVAFCPNVPLLKDTDVDPDAGSHQPAVTEEGTTKGG
jgi:hypothetical protein